MNGKVVIVSALLTVAVAQVWAMVGTRPERKPGNLTPIQLISAIGAWALVLANASVMAIAIRDGSLILLAAAAASITIALVCFIGDGVVNASHHETPEPLKLAVDDVKQLLGGAPRLGMESLEAIVVDGTCPGIGVAVVQQGRVVVRIRRDVARWLEAHQQAGGAGAAVVASFVRFTVLHELGHVLNGDHRTFRFVRSVLVAQLVWIPAALAAVTSLVVNREASARPLVVAASIAVLLTAQSLVARRFIAERERLADWRAMQALAPSDAARLLGRRGRRRMAPNPTELEKLLIDLKAQTPPGADGGSLSRLIALVWPEGDNIHRRSESAVRDHTGGGPQPVRWAALIGMQCGSFSMSLSLAAVFAAAPWIGWRRDVTETVMLTIMVSISGLAVMFCEMRVDPARTSVRKVKRAAMRIVVGAVYLFAFAAAALTLYSFYVRYGVVSMPPPINFAGMLMVVPSVVGPSVWASGVIGVDDRGGELLEIPGLRWALTYPALVGMVLLIPLSIFTTYWLDIGTFRSWQWLPLLWASFAVFMVSTGMARSTSPTLRVIAPMALLDTPPPVYGFRVFWRDFYVDLSRTTLARSAAIAAAVQVVTMPFFVLTVGLLTQRVRAVLSAETTFVVVFFAGLGMVGLFVMIPDPYRAYSGPWARLLHTDRLQVFEKLLAAACTASPSAANRLKTALGQWIRNECFPDGILPDARTVWLLTPLLSLVRLARETGETVVLERWRDRIERSLRQVVSNDAVAVAPGQPPSLYWTTLAAAIIDEAELREAFPFERMLDRIDTLLDERLAQGTVNLLADVVSACRLLHRQGRTGPDPQHIRRFAHASSLVSRPLLRQSLAELCELADLTGDLELREKLGPIVRSRLWEALQLNPRKDMLLFLDCYLAATCLGEADPRQQPAAVIVGEVAQRVADELIAIVNG